MADTSPGGERDVSARARRDRHRGVSPFVEPPCRSASGGVFYAAVMRPAAGLDRDVAAYLTVYSGMMTHAILDGVPRTAADVRGSVVGRLQFREAAVAGPSPEGDLRALVIRHAGVADTVRLIPHPAGPPVRFGVRALALRVLGRTIHAPTAAVPALASTPVVVAAATGQRQAHAQAVTGPSIVVAGGVPAAVDWGRSGR